MLSRPWPQQSRCLIRAVVAARCARCVAESFPCWLSRRCFQSSIELAPWAGMRLVFRLVRSGSWQNHFVSFSEFVSLSDDFLRDSVRGLSIFGVILTSCFISSLLLGQHVILCLL